MALNHPFITKLKTIGYSNVVFFVDIDGTIRPNDRKGTFHLTAQQQRVWNKLPCQVVVNTGRKMPFIEAAFGGIAAGAQCGQVIKDLNGKIHKYLGNRSKGDVIQFFCGAEGPFKGYLPIAIGNDEVDIEAFANAENFQGYTVCVGHDLPGLKDIADFHIKNPKELWKIFASISGIDINKARNISGETDALPTDICFEEADPVGAELIAMMGPTEPYSSPFEALEEK